MTHRTSDSKIKIISVLMLWTALALLQQANRELLSAYDTIPKCLPNKKRRRDHCEELLGSLNDAEFKSQTGLSRRLFNYVRSLIRDDIKVNIDMAQRSSGSHISTMMRLFIHQRLLKGMKALDAEWMGADPAHLWQTIWKPVALAIDRRLDNINFFANDAAWLEQQAQQWDLIITRK